MENLTRLLRIIEKGDVKAVDQLLPIVYEELRTLAAQKLAKESLGQTLQATALVHEAYLRLVGNQAQDWDSRWHFFSAAAEAMRRILVERARQKHCLKEGGGRQRIGLDDAVLAIEEPSVDIIALDEALEKLGKDAPLPAQVVKLRYFSGLTLEQVAQAMNVSRRTVSSYWGYARAWLHREMSQDGKPA